MTETSQTNEKPDWWGTDLDGQILSHNKRSYPTESGEPVKVTVLLVGGRIGDYAAYVGVGSHQWIKSYGDKLSFAEAQVHFPFGLDQQRYRER